MKAIFRAVFYLRSNYVNKEGKTPVMLRIYLNNERWKSHTNLTHAGKVF